MGGQDRSGRDGMREVGGQAGPAIVLEVLVWAVFTLLRNLPGLHPLGCGAEGLEGKWEARPCRCVTYCI
eukprot:1162143-Pelagomonas_calceolata.AAC.4